MKAIVAIGLMVSVWPMAGAEANMTIAAQGVGGLVPVKTDEISLEREDLFVSPNLIKVHYEFRNNSGKDVVAPDLFPLPEFDLYTGGNDVFVTPIRDGDLPLAPDIRVEGKVQPVAWLPHAYARDGREITERLKSLRIPLFAGYSFQESVSRLSETERSSLIQDGLIARFVNQGVEQLSPNWTVRAAFSWTQAFPANRKLVIDIEYVPLTGGYQGEFDLSTDISPEEAAQSFAMASSLRSYVPWGEEYCITPSVVSALRAMPGKKGDEVDTSVRWTRYILVTALNWGGPIKNFHLTIDKEKPDAVAAFCSPDRKTPIQQSGPTTYEVTIPNFMPWWNFDLLTVTREK